MSYTVFKDRWIGKRTDIDGAYRYQCVDLIRQYMHDELGLTGRGAWGNAIDYWTKTNQNVLNKFVKVAGTDAKRGDIVVFNGLSGNPYGHIGIIDANDTSRVLILEQNGSTGNGSGTGEDAIRLRWVSKLRIAGLLRIKGVGEMANRTQVNNIYKAVLHRDGDNGGLAHYTGQDANTIVASMVSGVEFNNHQTFLNNAAKQIQALKTALANEKNKPAKVITKEIEKIVTKIEKIEVPAEINEQEVVQGFFSRLWNNLFKGRK
jgi:hypothetical protein